jgi:hypothetical protein
MRELEDTIRYENENTNLDFKAIQYKKDKYESFLKDLISMANAKSSEDRFIIVGVNHKSNGDRDIIGIKEDFVDEAIYQQIITENVEPEIEFKYYPYEIDSIKLGVFHIHNCINPPYMLKKDFGKLKKGDSFIRKGSHQTRIIRKDIDYYISQKIIAGSFSGTISLKFSDSNSKTLILKPIQDLELPSDKAAKKIEKIIKDKEEKLKKTNDGFGMMLLNQDIPMIGGTPYENRSISTLKENLESVKETYQDDDLYYLFEVKSEKINLTITNIGKEYLEDASIEIFFIKNEKFLIAKSVHSEPDNRSWIERINYVPSEPSWDRMHYPKITENEKEYVVFESIGDVKHNIPKNVFQVPIRFVAGQSCIGEEITIKTKVFGKNLPKPIEDELKIIIQE